MQGQAQYLHALLVGRSAEAGAAMTMALPQTGAPGAWCLSMMTEMAVALAAAEWILTSAGPGWVEGLAMLPFAPRQARACGL